MAVAEVDKTSIVQKIEDITKEKGFIYSLTIILLQGFFHDPEEAADIDWHSKLSFLPSCTIRMRAFFYGWNERMVDEGRVLLRNSNGDTKNIEA